MSRDEVLKDFEKILDLSYKYCDKDMQDKEFEDFIQNLAQQINAKAFLVRSASSETVVRKSNARFVKIGRSQVVFHSIA